MACRITIPDDFPKVISGTKVEEKLRTLGEVQICLNKAKTQEELLERNQDSEVVINLRAYTHLTREILRACPKLRLISICGTGTDNVDLRSSQELGITVTNTAGVNALSVAEHTIAILLSLARQIPRLDREVHAGGWPRMEMIQLNGKVIGLLGLGAIGQHVARMAQGLGMEVIVWTRNPSPERARENRVQFVSKEELLKRSDVVSLHLSLTDETRKFLTKQDFDRMKPTAFLVNTARAALIEPGALMEALRSNKIAGAALDAFDQEPLPPGDPLTTLPNVIMTPHNAGMTPEAIFDGLMMAVENVKTFLAGKKINPAYVVVKGTR